MDRLFAFIQWCLPTRALSRLLHTLAEARAPWLKNLLIQGFLRRYRVDLSEAEDPDPASYSNFNAFFTRRLAADARPLPVERGAVACPVDGRLGAFGIAERGRLFQAKGVAYNVTALLGGREEWAAPFLAGHYATLYLAPSDYHRVHMPVSGVLRETLYVPGRLFGVNPASVRAIPRLFTRNERLVARFETPAGPMAAVLVGAFGVGGISTVWDGDVTPPHQSAVRHETYPRDGGGSVHLARGEELGAFRFGSTVVLLFGPGAIDWRKDLHGGAAVRMGETLARAACGV
jgi:phosphatidylserine decarboxylase